LSDQFEDQLVIPGNQEDENIGLVQENERENPRKIFVLS
jgi:hypothetical protein